MNYTQSLENLRKQLQNRDLSEETAKGVEPIRPSGFMPQVARPRSSQSQVQPQQPQYDPNMVITRTYEKLQEARRNFEKKMAELQKQNAEKAQTRPQVRPFGLGSGQTSAESGVRGFMTRPYSREDAARDRSEFDSTNRPRGPAGSGAPMEELQAVAQAIKDIESSGGNYEARGPVVETGMYAGERAMGAYQVMPGNLPQWSREALGREVSEEEFMSNPEIQDAIFLHQMQKSYQQYGSWEDAASVWFTGRPLSRAANATDGYMAAPEYVRRFSEAYNSYRSGS